MVPGAVRVSAALTALLVAALVASAACSGRAQAPGGDRADEPGAAAGVSGSRTAGDQASGSRTAGDQASGSRTAGPGEAAPASPIPADTRQLVVGVAPSWTDTVVTLRRYAREPGGAWTPVGDPWPAIVGVSGVAWGRGLHGDGAPAGEPGPVKREGDGKAPAGAFTLLGAYGYAAEPVSGTRLPYTPVDDAWRCVDDPKSAVYNRVLDAAGREVDWESAEVMRRADDLYEWVIEIAHNTGARAPRPGAGSCIFFHVWSGPDGATAGCTAMDKAALEAMLSQLDPAARPVYVLLPRERYRALAGAWQLPPLGGLTSESKPDVAEREVRAFAGGAYFRWKRRNMEKPCPSSLDELAPLLDERDTKDPWGRPYIMRCGHQAPAGKEFGVLSKGEDGKEGTDDDIKSWE